MSTTPMSGNRCPEGQELWTGDNTCRTLYTFYYKARRVVAGGNEVCSYHQQRAPDVQNAENILLRNLGGPEISGILSGSTKKDTVGIGTTTAVQSVCVCSTF